MRTTIARGAGTVVVMSLNKQVYSCAGTFRVTRRGGCLFRPGASVRGGVKHVTVLSSTTRTVNTGRGNGVYKDVTSFADFSFRTIGGLAATRNNTTA